jgi:hypothetical protein
MDIQQMLLEMQLTGGATFSVIDTPVLIAFLGYSFAYLLVPFLGYQAERRGAMTLALYLLVAYLGLALLQFLFYAMQLFQSNVGGAAAPPKFNANGFGAGPAPLVPVGLEFGALAFLMFTVLKMAIFMFSLLAFVTGLRSLRFNPVQREPHFGGEEGKIG